jgi:hypothetical protein
LNFWKAEIFLAQGLDTSGKSALGADCSRPGVAFIIGEYPPVLVTVEENDRMSKLGFCAGGAPEQRYAEIPFSGFNLCSDDAGLHAADGSARSAAR